jgi:hypothetical protein
MSLSDYILHQLGETPGADGYQRDRDLAVAAQEAGPSTKESPAD